MGVPYGVLQVFGHAGGTFRIDLRAKPQLDPDRCQFFVEKGRTPVVNVADPNALERALLAFNSTLHLARAPGNGPYFATGHDAMQILTLCLTMFDLIYLGRLQANQATIQTQAIDNLFVPWSRHPTWLSSSSRPSQIVSHVSVITPGNLKTALTDILGRSGSSAAIASRTILSFSALFSCHKRLLRLEHCSSTISNHLMVWGVVRDGRQLKWFSAVSKRCLSQPLGRGCSCGGPDPE